MNADKRRYNAANLRSFAFICGSNSPVYLAGDYKLILIGYSQTSPNSTTVFSFRCNASFNARNVSKTYFLFSLNLSKQFIHRF